MLSHSFILSKHTNYPSAGSHYYQTQPSLRALAHSASPETTTALAKQWSITQADAQWIVAQGLLSALTQLVLN